VVLEPHGALHLVSSFAGTTATERVGQIDGAIAGPVGVRGRAEFGLWVIGQGGFGLDLSGSYDGIGAGDYPAFGGQIRVRLPLR
jgi:hypothetical protein